MSSHHVNDTRSHAPVAGFGSIFFAVMLFFFMTLFVLLWAALVAANLAYIEGEAVRHVLLSLPIRAALWLSLWTSALTVVLVTFFSVPIGYALCRYRFPGRVVVDSLIDLPILLPPLIVGLSLLVFFSTDPGQWIEHWIMKFVFRRPGIVLCQFLVSASFGIRAVKLTFDGIDPRLEHVAMTLGSSRMGAFVRVALPMAKRGIIAGAILVWARAIGIFGPLMVLVGAVRMKTEVLPTTIYLEQSIGNIDVALAVAIVMLAMAAVALVAVRVLGLGER